jgi:aminoglycoside phosphotransferase (APT) family kinase protein
MESCCGKGFLAAEATIPPALFRRHAEIWPATLNSIAVHGTQPRTFTHNDVHLRNWYIAPNGQMALCDWQNFASGHWGRDFAYAISTSLTIADRRAWEKDLLHHYLDRLQAAGGPVVAFDDAWKFYRQHLFSTLAWWTATLAVGTTQPGDAMHILIGRIATAIDDLDALSSFD